MTTFTVTSQATPSFVDTKINYFPAKGGTTSYTTGSAAFFNRTFTPTDVRVEDIRGKERDFSLDKQGFQLISHHSRLGNFKDEGRIKEFYFPETEALIQKITGATLVKGFSHEVRSANLDTVLESIDLHKEKHQSPPAMYAHIDNGPEWARLIFRQILGPEDAERFRRCRWAIINAWRPIKPVTRNPLGVCDTSTVVEEDLVPVYARLTPTWGNTVTDMSAQQSQVYNVKANPRHRWYFASEMQPDEVLLITIFDTNKSIDGHPRRVVHSAFPHDVEEGGNSPRESIEFRSLVVWEDQQAEI